MKKLLLLMTIAFSFLNGFSQFSINMIQEMDVYDAKTASVSVVHSDGYIYNFQSSMTKIYVMKLNASTFAPVSNAAILSNQGNRYTIKGAFEDPEGNIIIYGYESILGFIFKIDVSTLSIINGSRIYGNAITYGCWGEKQNASNIWERAYAFTSSSGKIFITNSQLVYNSNEYFIQNTIPTQISWHSNAKKFVCSGYTTLYNNLTTNLPFLIVFDCKASYSSGWCNYFKFVLDESFVKINAGIVGHAILDNSNIVLTQTYTDQVSTTSKIQCVYFSLMFSYPYIGTILWNKRYYYKTGSFSLTDFKKNPSNNKVTLLAKYSNTSNSTSDIITSLTCTSTGVSGYIYSLDDEYLNLKSLYYNPFDESGIPLMNATGLYKSADGIYRVGAMLYEHYNYVTECQSQWYLTHQVDISTNYGIITDSYATMSSNFVSTPQANILNTFGVKGLCGEYHTGLQTKEEEKSLMTNQETTITLFESQEFLLQGFKGSVSCEIYDMTGKLVYRITTENDMNNSIPDLSKGIYILKAIDNFGNNKTVKFFKD
jgi:hypothetical protein